MRVTTQTDFASTPVTESSIRNVDTPTNSTHHVATATDWTKGGGLGEGWRWVWLGRRGFQWIWIKEVLTSDAVELARRVTSATTETDYAVLEKRILL